MTKVRVPIMHCLQWFNTNSQPINCEMIPYWIMFNNHAISTHIHVPDRSCDKPSFQIKMYTKNEKSNKHLEKRSQLRVGCFSY